MADNKETNYYLQQRYLTGELNTDKISFEPDSGNKMYNDNSQESQIKREYIVELDNCIQNNETIKNIIDNIPLERTINLPILSVNKLYLFCVKSMKTNPILTSMSHIEMFALITSYLNLNEKETSYFYSNLSIKFKSILLEELKKNKLYKNNRLF